MDWQQALEMLLGAAPRTRLSAARLLAATLGAHSALDGIVLDNGGDSPPPSGVVAAAAPAAGREAAHNEKKLLSPPQTGNVANVLAMGADEVRGEGRGEKDGQAGDTLGPKPAEVKAEVSGKDAQLLALQAVPKGCFVTPPRRVQCPVEPEPLAAPEQAAARPEPAHADERLPEAEQEVTDFGSPTVGSGSNSYSTSPAGSADTVPVDRKDPVPKEGDREAIGERPKERRRRSPSPRPERRTETEKRGRDLQSPRQERRPEHESRVGEWERESVAASSHDDWWTWHGAWPKSKAKKRQGWRGRTDSTRTRSRGASDWW